MELGAKAIAAPHDGRERLAMGARGQRVFRYRCAVTMHEIRLGACRNAIEQRMRIAGLQGVPAHVRNPDTLTAAHARDNARHEPQALHFTFFGGFIKQLHTQADAEQRLS